ncbi:MAG TPA: WD40 repeat domain-containing protein [Pyrinomonadaceae bacterium]|nr:WD40 repeat domain-containing protein [Pyrinomonadaceae bacterium]
MPKDPKPGVIGLDISRDGKTLVAAGTDGIIRIWDVESGKVSKTITGHTNSVYVAVLSPDEKRIASSSRDTTVRIWDAASGRELKRLEGFQCSVKSVAFSPDGKTLAASGNDGVVKVWEVASGRELRSLVHSTALDVDTSIYSLVFDRNRKTLFAGNGDGMISQWDTASGKEVNVWKAHNEAVIALVFTSDHHLLISDGYNEANIKTWDLRANRASKTFGGKTDANLTEQSHVAAVSSDAKLVATSVTGFDPKKRDFVYVRTYVWDFETGRKLYTFEDQKFDVGGLVFSPDDRYLIAGSADTTIRFYDLKTGRAERVLSARTN